MQGTITNVLSIIIGSLLGSILGNRLNPKYSDSSLQCMGLVALSLGISWITNSIPDSQYPLLFIITLVLGNLLGEVIGIDDKIQRFQKTHASDSDKPSLVQGLTTTTILFCLGTFSILGPIKARISQDYTLLYTNALLDGITCIIFGATYGFKISITGIFLFVWQGSIYLLARHLEPFMTTTTITELNIIGGILILCSGLNILQITKFKTLNMLPSILLSLLYMIVIQLF